MQASSIGGTLAALSLTALIAIPTAASAATVRRIPLQNAVADCQGALPSFEGAFRKRPTAIANEGDSTAFLSCSMQADDLARGNTMAAVAFRSSAAVPQTVTCTLVTNTVNFPKYYARSIVLPPGGGGHIVFTSTADNAGATFDAHINFNCALPPRVEANYLYREYLEDVGA